MKIVTLSLFRDASQKQVDLWARQVVSFRNHVAKAGHELEATVVEGDSKDDTPDRVLWGAAHWGLDMTMVRCHTGQPNMGSVEHPVRLQALSDVLNAGLDAAAPDADVVFYVESDLVWLPAPMGVLVDTVYERRHGFDVAAPMIMCGPDDRQFYDVWAFRYQGTRFGPFKPYCSELSRGPLELDSVGSCLAFSGEVARNVRVQNGNALVGWCDEARSQGYVIGVCPSISVRHP